MNLRAIAIGLIVSVAGCADHEEGVSEIKAAFSGPYVELWTGTNYTGSSFTVASPTELNDLSFTTSGQFNDVIKSVRVFNGAAIYLFEHHSWTGSYLLVNSNVPNLATYGFSNMASSLLWTPISGGIYPQCGTLSPCVELWEHANFTGDMLAIYGYLDMNDLYYTGWDDLFSSVKVSSGHSIRLCADYNWSGTCVTLTSNVSDLTSIGMNDVISSFTF